MFNGCVVLCLTQGGPMFNGCVVLCLTQGGLYV